VHEPSMSEVSRRHHPLPAIALAASALVLVIVACGASPGATPVGATNPTGDANPVNLSRCMRAHGISNFPDPRKGPDGSEGLSISESAPGNGTLTVFGTTFSGPAFAAAQKACGMFLGGGPGHRGGVSAHDKTQALALAKCMRAHGVPNFPDPTFPASGGIVRRVPAGGSAVSPAFQRAQAACAGA
jgi:hypothetical protein